MKLILLICCLARSFFSANGQACPPASPSTKPVGHQLNKDLATAPASSPKIFIRCAGTLNNETKPVVVINGIVADEADIHSLNPADIEAIHILKDTAATSLIGCRAMNGAIIIVTKKARHRSFIIRDATKLVGIPAATIRAELHSGNESVSFISDELGRIETDSLRSLDYLFTVSAPGYQTKTLGLKQILKNKGEIYLEKAPTVQPSVQIETAVRLYPNPVVTGGAINISFHHAKTGTYHIRLFNAAGHLIEYVQKPFISTATAKIQLGQTITPGIYVVQVSDDTNQIMQTSKLLVK